MVLLTGVKGTASLEFWNGQLSLSGKVLSPHMVSIKLGYLGNKNMDFEMGQSRTIFPLLWGKMALGEACPTSSFSPQESGKSCREQSGGGSRDESRHRSRQLRGCWACRCLPAVEPDFLFNITSICFSPYPLLECFTSLFPSSLRLSLKCATPTRVFISIEFFHPCPLQKKHWTSNCIRKKKSFFSFLLFPSAVCLL